MPPKLRDLKDSPFFDRIEQLIAAAREVRARAYARESTFMVGAAALTADGKIHVGVNVEAVDYDATHAEESVFSAMCAAGSVRPVMIVAVGSKYADSGGPIIPPCGKCRQKIIEWIRGTEHDIDVIVIDPVDGFPKLCSIRELLPLSFG